MTTKERGADLSILTKGTQHTHSRHANKRLEKSLSTTTMDKNKSRVVYCLKESVCEHRCLFAHDGQECPPCRHYVKYTQSCGHPSYGYCGYGPPQSHLVKCLGICGKKNGSCGHPCPNQCGHPNFCEAFKCKYCKIYAQAQEGKIPMPLYFLFLGNGVKEDDSMGPKFVEACKGMTREMAENYRQRLNSFGTYKLM